MMLLFANFYCFIGSAGCGSVELILRKSLFSHLVVVSLKNGSGHNDQLHLLFHDFLLTLFLGDVGPITTPWNKVFKSVPPPPLPLPI